MKNIRKALIALCLVAVLLVGAIFTVIATTETPEYTGTMEELNELVADLDELTSAESKSYSKIRSAVKKIADYITEDPVDPTLEGYDEAMAKTYAAAVMCAVDYITFGEGDTVATKAKGLTSAEELIGLFPDIDTSAADYVAYAEQATAVATELTDSYLAAAEEELAKDTPALATAEENLVSAQDLLDSRELPGEDEYAARAKAVAGALVDAYIAEAVNAELAGADTALASVRTLVDTYALSDKQASYDETVVTVATNAYNSAALTQGEDGLWTTATSGSKLNALGSFLKANPLNESVDGVTELLQNIENLRASIDEKTAENLATLDDVNSLTSYENAFDIREDFSSYDTDKSFTGGAIGPINGSVLYNDSYFKIEESADGNKYFVMKNGDPKGGSYFSHNFQNLSGNPTLDGFVIEFRAKADPEHTDGLLNLSTGGLVMFNGNRAFPTNYFKILSGGELKGGDNDKSGVSVPNALSADRWTHFMVIFDPDAWTLSVYCDGQLITTFNAKYQGEHTFDYAKAGEHGVRMTIGGADYILYVDDFCIYTGTAYRNPDKLIDMTSEERFIYYVDYALNPDKDPIGRETAYGGASDLLSEFYAEGEYLTEDADVIAAVDRYNNEIDPVEIGLLVANFNRDSFVSMVENLDAMERTAANLDARALEYNKITDFLKANTGKINEDESYSDAKYNFDYNLTREVSIDTSIESFNLAMQRFDMIDSLGGKQKYLEKAKALVEAETYPLDQTVYEELKDLTDENREAAFPEFIAAYATYDTALEIVAAMERDEESRKIVACVNFIKMYTTEDEWLANYDYINRYILILRETVRSKNYNPDYEGVDEALIILAPMEEWFYAQLQDQHVNVLRETIDQIAYNDSYVVKMGLCSYVERYLASNDIDLTYGDIPLLLIEFDTHQQELEYRERDYAELLIQNAHYFKSLVDTMVLSETYADVKYYYDMAYSYYFFIDATVDGVQERIDIFDSYTATVDLAENSSKEFKENVVALEVIFADEDATDNDIFYALVDCYGLISNIETDIDGVTAALDSYIAIAEKYLAEIGENNSELYAAISMMSSLRASSGISSVMSVAMKFIFD